MADVDTRADCDESRCSLSNIEDNFGENCTRKVHAQKQALKVENEHWDINYTILRVFVCLLILFCIILQNYMDYRALKGKKGGGNCSYNETHQMLYDILEMELYTIEYEEFLSLDPSCSSRTIFVWPSKGQGDFWAWEPLEKTLKVNTTLFVR
nr:uncharacterized protein LOC105331020 isoform X2 [Crassostrea gigas]